MDSGLSTSAVGMLAQFNVENNISDNLSNMQTPGYKERTAVVKDFPRTLLNSQSGFTALASDQVGVSGMTQALGVYGSAPQIESYGLNLAQGAPKYTGQPLDLTIVGNAFLQVKSGNGILMTRDGALTQNSKGVLETSAGYPVLDKAGKVITIPAGTKFSITKTGQIRADGTLVAQLGLASVPAGQSLTEQGTGYFTGPGTPVPVGTANIGVLQGYVETSNVDLSTQMSNMLSAQRAYQQDSQMLQIQDTTMGLAVNDLGKV